MSNYKGKYKWSDNDWYSNYPGNPESLYPAILFFAEQYKAGGWKIYSINPRENYQSDSVFGEMMKFGHPMILVEERCAPTKEMTEFIIDALNEKREKEIAKDANQLSKKLE